jgi:hypothetical protein
MIALLAAACKAPPLPLLITQNRISVSCDGNFRMTVGLELAGPPARPFVLRAVDPNNIVADPVIEPRDITLEPSKEKLVVIHGRLLQPCDPGRFRLEADSGGAVEDQRLNVDPPPLRLDAPAEVTTTGDRFRYDVTATCCPAARPTTYTLDLVGGIGVADTRIAPTSVSCPGPTAPGAPPGPPVTATVMGRLGSQEDEEAGEARLGCRATDPRGLSCIVVTRIKR